MATQGKIPMLGKRFGKLTVIAEGPRLNRKYTWICQCDCGTVTRPIYGYDLRNGKVKACGCLRGYNRTTHGLCHTRLHSIWTGMKSRCCRPTAGSYDTYGGRGVTVCEEWKTDFKAFYDWAVANGYQDGLTLDRIDPDGNYEPQNCRWATWKEQAANKRHLKERK
jgi:hypothetical protein